MCKNKILILDTETTGINDCSEILQLSRDEMETIVKDCAI